MIVVIYIYILLQEHTPLGLRSASLSEEGSSTTKERGSPTRPDPGLVPWLETPEKVP